MLFRSPLAENLPRLLTAGGVRTPAVGILLLILIGKHGFEGATMQIELHHIGSSESALREGSKEEFVDDPFPRCSHRSRSWSGWMSGNNHSARHTSGSDRGVGTIVERPPGSCFRVRGLEIGGTLEARLHLCTIEQMVVFTPHDIGELRQMHHDGSIPILPIQPHHGLAEAEETELS